MKKKLELLKKINDEHNIFLDFSAQVKREFLGAKRYKFKIYYRYKSSLESAPSN